MLSSCRRRTRVCFSETSIYRCIDPIYDIKVLLNPKKHGENPSNRAQSTNDDD